MALDLIKGSSIASTIMVHTSHTILVFALLACTLSAGAQATSYASPQRRDVMAPGGAFVLDVNPDKQQATVYKTHDRDRALWSFERSMWQEKYFLADDGQSVAVLAWKHVQVFDLDQEALQFFKAEGKFKTYAYDDLVVHPSAPRGIGPIGPFWREWFDSASSDGKSLTLVSSGPSTYHFDLSTGEIRNEAFSPRGGLLWILGVLILHLGIILVFRWRRAIKRALPDAKKIRLISLGPLACCVHMWLFLAGVPFVPAVLVFYLQIPLWFACLFLGPFSLVVGLRRPKGHRLGSAILVASTFLLAMGMPWLLWL